MNKEVEEILKRLEKNKPTKALRHLDPSEEGIRHAMMYLSEEDNASAGDISRNLEISTARVAVLIRKMQEKGLVIKKTDPEDARKARIALTEKGEEMIRKARAEFEGWVAMIVEQVGAERINLLLDISEEIKEAMKKNGIPPKEKLDEWEKSDKGIKKTITDRAERSETRIAKKAFQKLSTGGNYAENI